MKKLFGILLVLLALSGANAQAWEYAILTISTSGATGVYTWYTPDGLVQSDDYITFYEELTGGRPFPSETHVLVAIFTHLGSDAWELAAVDKGFVDYYHFKRLR